MGTLWYHIYQYAYFCTFPKTYMAKSRERGLLSSICDAKDCITLTAASLTLCYGKK